MATALNTKIQLRTDTKENWESYNPVLKLGEIAIVCLENDYKDIKIGNGISSFTQLSYLYQNAISADSITGKDLHVKSIAQGFNVKATPTSLATGVFAEAEGNFNVVHGIEAKAKQGDDYAFVFNGTNLPGISERYQSHGEGTFNINPLSGLSGFYIGNKNLAEYYYEKSQLSDSNQLSTEFSRHYTKTESNSLYLDLDEKIAEVDETHVKLSSDQTQQLSTNLNVEGFIKVGGITAQGRKFVEIASTLVPPSSQSTTNIGQVYLMIDSDFANSYYQGHMYLLTSDISSGMKYVDITDLNEMSATYSASSKDLEFHSHVGSAVYDEEEQDLSLQIKKF